MKKKQWELRYLIVKIKKSSLVICTAVRHICAIIQAVNLYLFDRIRGRYLNLKPTVIISNFKLWGFMNIL